MNEYTFNKTDDNSTGLYNNVVNDIYHSSSGAIKESLQKFIFPSGIAHELNTDKKINILDVCYGIGYNSKAAIYYLSRKNKIKVHIDALEINKDLIYLSPLINDCIPSKDIDFYLMQQIADNFSDYQDNLMNLIFNILDSDIIYFNPRIIQFLKNYYNSPSKYSLNSSKSPHLHNIYYHYISNSIKKDSKYRFLENINIEYHTKDARRSMLELGNAYDYIFLDAFTPLKDPTLWTYDFLKLIKSRMNPNSVLISYSNSTPFRSALVELKFYVGKIINNKKSYGTIASTNPEKIQNLLNEYEIGLTKTRSGIFYKDPGLNLSKNEIIMNRTTEKSNSDIITASKYKKIYMNE